MDLIIRKYSKSDVQSLLALFHDTVHSIDSKDYTTDQINAWMPSAIEGIETWKERFKKEKTLIAEADGKITGFGGISENRISMLYVSKDFQRQGVGKAILKKLEKKLKKSAITKAIAEVSITARPFFERCGYQLVRENQKMFNGQAFTNFLMEKKLQSKGKEMKKVKSVASSKPFRWRDLFINKFFDLVIVIAGVTIAFQLNNLKLENDARSLERFYLESLASDLKKDSEEMRRNQDELKTNLKAAHMVVAQLNQITVPPDSIAHAILDVLGFSTFDQHNNTYNVMVNGNGLTVLGNAATRSLVAEYYGGYTGIRRFESVYTEVLLSAFDYFSPSIDLARQHVVDETVFGKTQTVNHLLILESQIQDGINHYQESLEDGEALLQMLENDLRN